MDKKSFECEECNVTFKTQIGYKRHKEFIHNKEPNSLVTKYECNMCNKTFKTKGNLDYHTRNVHHLTKHLQCELCNYKAKYQRDRKLHFMRLHPQSEQDKKANSERLAKIQLMNKKKRQEAKLRPKQTYKCEVCDTELATMSSYSNHVKRHKPPEHHCNICKKSFHQKENLKKHNKVVHRSKKTLDHACEQCDKSFFTKEYLYKHIRSVHSEQQFSCDQCSYIGKNKEYLWKHMNGTHNSERFDCSMCGTQFKHKKTLESHFKTVHGKVNFKHINCPHCEYKSSRNEHMQMHIDAVHLGLRPFKCDVCDKDFTQKTHLRTHQKNVHENVQDTRFKCDECSKFYQSNQQLREHTERVHLKMKLLHCEVCGKGWNSKQELNRHSFVHKEYSERPYECSDCSKRFCHEPELKYHQNTCQLSKEERNALIKQDPNNYCNLCSKFYANLQQHIRRNHSSEKRFQCEVCGYGVNSYQELSRHTYIHKSMNCRDFECEVCKMKYVTLYELKDHQRRTKCLSN